MSDSYTAFLASKQYTAPAAGFEVAIEALNPALFPFQSRIVRWALRKGRAAIFATTGMGKTAMQLEWAHQMHRRTGRSVLIAAPLAVTAQTVAEGAKFGIAVVYARSQAEAADGITITNYEMLHHFDPSRFGAVVLDESGILKNFSGTIKKRLIQMFRVTPYRLACTATPAPNDVVELCNHADFLEVMKANEIVSTFFTPRGLGGKASGEYRLKRHARAAFFRWLASWSVSLTRPSDLGFSDDGFILPPLDIRPVIVPTDWAPADQLIFTGLRGITHRSEARRATVDARVDAVARLIEADTSGAQWLVWCGLTDEGRKLAERIPGAVVVEGPQSPDAKVAALSAFAAGQTRVLVTKVTIAGFGMNFQRCHQMAFVGLGDSFEQYFQAIRRCWRFGQERPVAAHVVLSDVESAVYENVLRKEQEHEAMMRELIAAVVGYEREEIGTAETAAGYESGQPLRVPVWLQSVVGEELAVCAS